MLISKKISELKINKYYLMLIVSVLLVALFIIFGAAWSNNAVNIFDEEKVINVKTKQSTVADVLNEADITLHNFDRVEPDADSLVSNNMNIRISRACKITIIDDGIPVEYYTSADTVEGALNQTGYSVGENDIVNPTADTFITEELKIEIHRACKIYLSDDKFKNEEPKIYYTHAKTVGDFLSEQGLSLADGDDVNLEFFVKIKNDIKIKISRVEVKYEEETKIINFSEVTREANDLAKGITRVAQEGRNGAKKLKYEVKLRNGEEIGRTCINSSVVKSPVNRIVEVGTNANTSSASTNKDFSYSRMLKCTATAYDLSYESCGKNPGDPYYGITASGMKAQYGVIAVDTSVIPLGTRMYVEAVDGSWVYGYCVAGDTGSGIKGNKIDLFYNSRNEAISFGRRQANVYILN